MGLFDPATGGSNVSLTSGSPAYQDAIVSGAQRSLKPLYQKALGQTRQNLSSRGLLDSGIGIGAEAGLQQDFLGQLGGIATGAATKGADLTEENRRRTETRGWQMDDRDTQLNFLREQAHAASEQAGADRWANLIGAAGGAVGNVFGKGLFGMLGKGGAGGANPDALSSLPDYQGGGINWEF